MDDINNTIEKLQQKIDAQQRTYKVIIAVTIIVISAIMLYIASQLFAVIY